MCNTAPKRLTSEDALGASGHICRVVFRPAVGGGESTIGKVIVIFALPVVGKS